jgi:hypothetical protein
VAVWRLTTIFTTVLAALKTEEGRATICLFIVLVLCFIQAHPGGSGETTEGIASGASREVLEGD